MSNIADKPVEFFEPIFDGFKVVGDCIGFGSFGYVYNIIRDDSDVKAMPSVIKYIPIEEGDEYKVPQIINEIELMYALEKAVNIVNIYDHKKIVKEDAGGKSYTGLFIRMEKLTPLPHKETDKPLRGSDVVDIGIDICSALIDLEQYGEAGILHGDIKPENIFSVLSEHKTYYKLGDFGISKYLESDKASRSVSGFTKEYRAPETRPSNDDVFGKREINSRADIYSLGKTLYKLLNKNVLPTMTDNVNFQLTPLKKPVPKALSDIILKACYYDADERYQSPRDMRDDLEKFLGNENVDFSVFRECVLWYLDMLDEDAFFDLKNGASVSDILERSIGIKNSITTAKKLPYPIESETDFYRVLLYDSNYILIAEKANPGVLRIVKKKNNSVNFNRNLYSAINLLSYQQYRSPVDRSLTNIKWQRKEILETLQSMRYEPLDEYEQNYLSTLILEFMMVPDKKLYYEKFKREDRILINEIDHSLKKEVITDYILSTTNRSELKHRIPRKYTYSGTRNEFIYINDDNHEDERRRIFNDAYTKITITIDGRRYEHDECFRFFRIATEAHRFKEGVQSNLTTLLILDDELQRCNKEKVRLVTEETRVIKPINGSSLFTVYRLPYPTKQFKYTCILDRVTPKHWQLALMPILPGYSINENANHRYYTDNGELNNADPYSKSFAFSNWLPQGVGITYTINFGIELLGLEKKKTCLFSFRSKNKN